MHDVVVVGGSIAGAAVAIAAARAGRRVLLLEQHEQPRRKACGEGILPRGVAALASLGLEAQLAPGGARLERLRFEAGSAWAEAAFPAPGLGIRRPMLEQALLACARSSGVEVRTGVTARSLEIADRRVAAIVTDAGRFPGRAVVAADGLHSRLRRLAHLETPGRGTRYGVSVHLRLPGLAADTVRVRFTRAAEIYTTPTGTDEANVAILLRKPMMKHLAGNLDAAVCRLLAEDSLLCRGQLLDAPLVAGPFARGSRRPWRANLVLAGDAAGFFDGITGEGMSLALATAPAIAAAIERYLDSGCYEGFRDYTRTRRAMERPANLLGRMTLLLGRDERLAGHAIRNLGRQPATFARLVAVSAGEAPLTSLRPSDALALATGW